MNTTVMSINEKEPVGREWATIGGFHLMKEQGLLEPAFEEINNAALERLRILGFPGRRHEMFTFADVSGLPQMEVEGLYFPHAAALERLEKHMRLSSGGDTTITFINGFYSATLSDVSAFAGAVKVIQLSEAIKNFAVRRRIMESVQRETDYFAALNAAYFRDGAAVFVSPGARLDRPLTIKSIFAPKPGSTGSTFPRVYVELGEGAEAGLMFTSSGDAKCLSSAVVDITLGPRALARQMSQGMCGAGSWNFSKISVAVAEEGSFNGSMAFSGPGFTRDNLEVHLAGPGASAEVTGVTAVSGKSQAHVYARVYHDAPNCVSNQFYRNAVSGQSRASVDTTVIVAKGSTGAQSRQTVYGLLLSKGSRADAKPNLMIYNDDVKCSHGATVGRLSDEQLFYLKSRGIPEKRAIKALVESFLREALARFPEWAAGIGETLFEKIELGHE
ncbi:MAG: SufD family Fe-S cluster assembly protein [Nitrospinae bacterium]|nr:SufD family Fe-S cluster assembly protein [Nitrospinota bacterium]